MWEAVETEVRKVRVAETKGGRKEERSRKETGRKRGKEEERKEKTKKDRSKESSRRMGNME